MKEQVSSLSKSTDENSSRLGAVERNQQESAKKLDDITKMLSSVADKIGASPDKRTRVAPKPGPKATKPSSNPASSDAQVVDLFGDDQPCAQKLANIGVTAVMHRNFCDALCLSDVGLEPNTINPSWSTDPDETLAADEWWSSVSEAASLTQWKQYAQDNLPKGHFA